MRFRRIGAVGAISVAVAILATACGSSSSSSSGSSSASKETITIASFNFGESEILANLYRGVLEKAGVTVVMKDKLGTREIVEPALQSGQVDLVPEYIGTDLEYLNKSAGVANGDVTATFNNLNAQYKPLNITALTPSSAADQNAFAVTQATATQYSLKNTSDLAPVAAQFTLGGPAECPTRPFCQPGLKTTYGLNFKAFKSLDPGGPLTKAALDSGAIQVGLLFSSDSSIAADHYVVLVDDKHLQTADNIAPVIRNDKLNSKVSAALDGVSAALTSEKLIVLNKQVDIDKADPATVADQFLKDNKLS